MHWLALAMLLAAALLVLSGGPADIVKSQMETDGQLPASNADLQAFLNAVKVVEGPAKLALMSVVPLGMIGGGAMFACGMGKKGMTICASSAGAGLVVLVGMGLVA
jgi:hypothetical protein